MSYKHTHDEARIRAAISSMPYGGLINPIVSGQVGLSPGHRPATVALADVATYLEALALVLRDVADQNMAREKALNQIESDVAAVRRVFGVPQGDPKP